MSGSHAYREEKSGILTSPAGRGVVAALAFGTVAGSFIPAASADSAPKAHALKAVSNPHSVAPASVTKPVTAPADAEWKLERISLDETASLVGAFKVEAPRVEVATQPERVANQETAESRADAQGATRTRATATEDTAAVASQAAPVSVVPSGSGSSIVSIALQYAGSPYRSGGTTPAGFDCSGFTSYVYRQAGISLPRSSSAQRSAGTVVPASQAQPGDLMWWPGHVGIYIGNGQHIAARNPKAGTAVGPNYGNPTFIRVA